MENIPARKSDEVDDPVSHARQVCLRTPLIVREIFQWFSNRELLKLSLVNKQWNFEARSLMRDRGTVSAKIKTSHRDLAAFASALTQMDLVPFAGMSIMLHHYGSCRSSYKGSLHPSYEVILERLPFKKLSLEFCIHWDTCKDCPAFMLVKQIFKDFGGALEEISLIISWELLEVLQQFISNCRFPRLKTLKLGVQDAHKHSEDFTKLVKAFVSRLPNLQELHIFRGEINFSEDVLEGSSAVLVPNRYRFNPLYVRVCESLVHSVRATIIDIQLDEGRDFNFQVLTGLVPMILQASRITLKTVRIDLLLAVPLMCYGICLENVTTLEIYLTCSLLERLSPGLVAVLKGFDFTRILPKLDKVKVNNYHRSSFSPARIRAFVEQGKVLLRRTLPDRAINIRRLKFYATVSNSTVPFLAQMFPHVKTLSVSLGHDPRIPFTLLWENFKHVEELKVVHDDLPRSVGNLDSAFCGIFPEEVAELRGKDGDYLKAVNIVPVMPSLTYMKDLKKFTFQYSPHCHKLKKRDPTFIFSKVTGLVGFARCPDLAVEFDSVCTKALHHMKPYGSLKTDISIDYFEGF